MSNAWPMLPISQLGRVTTGSTPSTADEALYGGDIPFVTPSELDQMNAVVTAPRTLSPLGASRARLLPANTVMVCCIGSLGKVGIAGRSLVTNQQINSIEFDAARVWPRYGFYACRRLKPRLEVMAPATTVPIVSKSKFEALEIPVPPLPEQRRIAEILDKADALRAMRRAALAKLDALNQSIFLDMFGDPATNPKGWPITSLGDVILGIRNGVNREQKTGGEGWPITRIETISEGLIDQTRVRWIDPDPALLAGFRLEIGDILFSHINSIAHIGKTALYTGVPELLIHGINLLRIRPNGDAVDPAWLLHLLKHDVVRIHFRTRCKPAVNQASLNQRDIQTLRMFLPPVTLQREFAHVLQAAHELGEVQRVCLSTLNECFESLQHRAFHGEL